MADLKVCSTASFFWALVPWTEKVYQNLSNAVRSALERAVRDNDLVYVSPIPPANQLTPIVGVGMVKLATPLEIAEPVAWLMGGKAGMGPLFSGLVPYGVHVAISTSLFRHPIRGELNVLRYI